MFKKTAIYQKKRPGAPAWFNKWIQSPAWLAAFAGTAALCLVAYAVNALVGTVHPASTWGMGYGIAATVVLVAVLLFVARRRTMSVRGTGRSWVYLQVHVYGGALFLLLMFMHTGFGVPEGAHTWWLWVLSIWVVGTGFLGIAIQKWIPTVLSEGLSIEVHYDRVPTLVDDLRKRAEKLTDAAGVRVREYYRAHVADALEGPQPRLVYFVDVTGGVNNRTRQADYLRDILPTAERERLDELREIHRSKLEMDAHYTLQKALRYWLVLHVPVSIVMIALLGVHIFSVLYY
ncbi:MAG: hypothetical protein HKN17_02925 [Rhodothermales bacterium]|nr:hypothetical protein [Rhodothermales bacterium]